ncbi:MAG: hypothetical protein FLDDKLPJ_00778 [Phycisphaerae bacterium]|nr:hypothetical protein [Phycisphaerae bacterium]
MTNLQTLTLEAPGGFSLAATVLSHGWHECAPMSWSQGGACFQVMTRAGDEVRRISVSERERARDRVRLRVDVEGRDLSPDESRGVRDDLRLMLGLDHELAEFHELCRSHPSLHVVPRIGAGRLLRARAMSENVLKAVCATNVNWTQAVKMINRIAQLGPVFPHFRSLNAWPGCREILRAGRDYLVGVARIGYRADSILRLCTEQLSGECDLEALDDLARTIPTEPLRKRILALRGVGPATAGFLLSMLGHHDHLSIDSATLAHVSRTHLSGRRASRAAVEDVYAGYGRWKNLVYWFENWITWDTARRLIADAPKPVSRAKPVSREQAVSRGRAARRVSQS